MLSVISSSQQLKRDTIQCFFFTCKNQENLPFCYDKKERKEIMMTNKEKITIINAMLQQSDISWKDIEGMLERFGDQMPNFRDYLISEPLDYKKEASRIADADYKLCVALLTMFIQEMPDKWEDVASKILQRMRIVL